MNLFAFPQGSVLVMDCNKENTFDKGKTMKKPSGIILYEGPSLLDGKPIVCIATGFRSSKNPKTGNMLQTWIIRSHVNPVEAWKNGCDKSVCGDCLHRKIKSCYVDKVFAPNNVYKAYKRGKYEHLNVDNVRFLLGQKLRIGAYGDPAAVKVEVWERIIPFVAGITGYSHQWISCDQRLKKYLMASCDTANEAKIAVKKGWRTFRISLPWEKKTENEFVCPASKEGGNKTTCAKCLACGGLTSKIKKNPIIAAHGSFGKGARFVKIMKLRKNKQKFMHLVPNINPKKP